MVYILFIDYMKNMKYRLLQSAFINFYARGFDKAGINEILSEAGVYKKTMYHYFESKDDLGVAYIRAQAVVYLKMMRKITFRHDDFSAFWQSWNRNFRRMVQTDGYFGCPFANFNNQTLGRSQKFSAEISHIMQLWINSLTSGISRMKSGGSLLSKKIAESLAERLLVLIEGVIQMYMIQRNPKYLKILEEEGLRIAEFYFQPSL